VLSANADAPGVAARRRRFRHSGRRTRQCRSRRLERGKAKNRATSFLHSERLVRPHQRRPKPKRR
jgi:hypothetical protein